MLSMVLVDGTGSLNMSRLWPCSPVVKMSSVLLERYYPALKSAVPETDVSFSSGQRVTFEAIPTTHH